MSILKVEHISSGYGKKQVLYDFSFFINTEKLVLIIGSNGSGKSTLLKTICGLIKPMTKDGKIYLDGEDVTSLKPSERSKKGILYVPQENELFEDLTVLENLRICGLGKGKKSLTDQNMDEVLSLFPLLAGKMNSRCFRLSGGERKILTIAMSFVNKPKLIMFDEPLSGVSPNYSSAICEHLVRLKGHGITIIIAVTCPPHRDPALVIEFCWIEGGGYGQETVHSGAGHNDASGGGSPSQSI